MNTPIPPSLEHLIERPPASIEERHLESVTVPAVEQTPDCARMQHQLSSSEMHLALALDAVRMGIVDWDLAAAESRLSDSACEIFGLAPRAGTFSLEHLLSCVHPEDRDAVSAFFRAETLNGVVGVHEYRLLLPDGKVRWINTRGRLFRDSTGTAVRRVNVIVDITERKSLEAQYRQAQKMEAMGQLAGGIAHDFNNLLTIVGMVGEVARAELDVDHPVVRDLGEILAAVDRGRALTRQLLTFSRRDVAHRLRVDLGAILREMEPMLRRVTGPTLGLTLSGDSQPLVVFVDPNQLEQVVLNLVMNARDAMPQGGQIDISTRSCVLDDISVQLRPGLRAGRFALLTVSDNGIGMDAATQEHIFEPFFTTKGALHGTGLGLSSVFGIVKQAEGDVSVYSEPGEGTTFRIYLPLLNADDVDVRIADPVSTSLPRGSETVLVVDDEPLLRKVTHRILSELGYTVLQAGDGREAIQIINAYRGTIDVLLCDIALPSYDGREVSEAMSLMRPGVPTLFMSGYAADVVGERLYLDPQARFLEKPFTRQSLAQLVRATLDQTTLRWP